jgi:hypothetical protein
MFLGRLVKIKYIIPVLLLLLCSCRSIEENKDIAADSARSYIFSNIKRVSPENTRIIKYTYPRILKASLFLTRGQEYNQYYFAWDLKKTDITVMVFGTSRKGYSEWKPVRIVFKKYEKDEFKEITESTAVWSEKPTPAEDAAIPDISRGEDH